MQKRPKKNIVVDFLNTQFACLTNGIPGVTEEVILAQVDYGKYRLYENEVEGVVDKLVEKDANFDVEKYVEYLNKVDAIIPGTAPAFGGERGTTLDSREKALDVAADPTDEVQVAEIMRLAKVISDGRKDINKLLAKGVTLGVGFNSGARNKAKAKEEVDEEKAE